MGSNSFKYVKNSSCKSAVDQPADILPLSVLSDVIVAGYHPGHVVLIAMSHPTNFAIGQRDVVNYKRSNLFEHIFFNPYQSVGISFFFYSNHNCQSRSLFCVTLNFDFV